MSIIIQDGWTALMKAATDGYTEIADVLVKAGANKDLQNEVCHKLITIV